MHTLMIAVSTLAAIGLSGTGIIYLGRRIADVDHRIADVDHRLSDVKQTQLRQMEISRRGVNALEHLRPPTSPQRIPAHRR